MDKGQEGLKISLWAYCRTLYISKRKNNKFETGHRIVKSLINLHAEWETVSLFHQTLKNALSSPWHDIHKDTQIPK